MTCSGPEDRQAAYTRLATAMLVRALLDATSAYALQASEARRWLACEGVIFCEGLGLDPSQLLAWLEQGCPGLSSGELAD